MSPHPLGRLTIVEGPNPGSAHEIRAGSVLGRALDCQVHLKDLRVSRKHARIVVDRGHLAVEDLGSGNGTYVNDQPITLHRLQDGDVVRVSSIRLLFEELISAHERGTDLVTMVGPRPGMERPQIVATIDAMRSPFARSESLSGLRALQDLTAHLETVYAISHAIGSILDIDALLPEILERLFAVFSLADRGVIMLLDDKGEPVPKVARSTGEALKDGEIEVSKTVLSLVLRERQAVLTHDAMTDARFEAGKSVANLNIRSMMCCPLLFGGAPIGVVYVDSPNLSAFSNPDLDLLVGIATQAALAVGNASLHQELLKRQRLEQDLHLAERIQQSFLPKRIPTIDGYTFGAWYDPAFEVGGDFYDFIRLPNSQMGIVVGDVSGKGIGAALYMARLTRDIRYFALAEDDPGRVLMWMNRAVNDSGQDDIFVTLVYVVLDIPTGALTVASAGHMPPIVRSASGAVALYDEVGGLPLGVLEDTNYETERVQLVPGDVLLLYSDGLVEAMNEQEEMLGTERLVSSLTSVDGDARRLLDHTIRAMSEHVGSAAQFDDTTVVALSLDG